LNEGAISRRNFLRRSTLLGLSAIAAYAMAGMVDPSTSAKVQNLPKGGNLRIGIRRMEIKDPHLADFAEKSNVVREVCEKRRKGCALTADDVVRNLKRVCDPKVGSSMLGLFPGYLVEDFVNRRDTQGFIDCIPNIGGSIRACSQPFPDRFPRPGNARRAACSDHAAQAFERVPATTIRASRLSLQAKDTWFTAYYGRRLPARRRLCPRVPSMRRRRRRRSKYWASASFTTSVTTRP
jgi:hypothetical protein